MFNGPRRSRTQENKANSNQDIQEVSSMGSNYTNLIVGQSPLIRSRSSSVQMIKGLNTKNSENTIVVGRHGDKNIDTGKGDYRAVSQNNSLETPTIGSNNSGPKSGYRNPLLPIQVTIWFHELRTSDEDFMIDLNGLSNFKVGDILEMETLDQHKLNSTPNKIVFIIKEQNVLNTSNSINTSLPPTPIIDAQVNSAVNFQDIPSINDSGIAQNHPGKLPSKTQKSPNDDDLLLLPNKNKNPIQFSLINNPLQKIFDLLPRSIVQIRKISDPKTVEADLIEISIKNINISRDTMWVISSELTNSCVYHGKRVMFLNSRIGIIKNIYQNGKKQFSGYIGNNTKIVYRSESSRLIFLIQTSREMWHFEESGEIMFHKLVNNLFPKIFRKWREKDANHSITIVLFTSVDLTDIPWTALGYGERPNKVREYFRVVADQVSIVHWSTIMENLRLEFANFKRDILSNRVDEDSNTFAVEGVTLPAVKGNILEAINIGLNLIQDRFTDTDLKHSLNHLVVVTPGTGLFDVDYNLMIETSKKMSNTDCALDIISLSQPPLHIVPLFRFKDLSRHGKLTYCVPYWCDISFYKDSTSSKDQWIPRCKIYELQMMGLMENEVNEVEIERFKMVENHKAILESMDEYDNAIFKPITFKNTERGMSTSTSFGSIRSLALNNTPKLVQDSLLLINQPDLKPRTHKVNIGTTNSTALGMVTNLDPESSALSSLYQINTMEKPRAFTKLPGLTRRLSVVSELTIKSKGPTEFKPKMLTGKDLETSNQLDLVRDNNMTSANKLKERSDSFKRSSTASSDVKLNDNKKRFDYFWTEISNPSNELHVDALSFIKLGKWNQVFPSNIKRNSVKWRSFQSPAALPVYQPNFPTNEEIEANYTTQVYTLLLNNDTNLPLETIEDLMREMIQLRLLLGFQICDSEVVNEVEAERHLAKNQEPLIKQYKSNVYGSKIYMMLDHEIHRLVCEDASINVQLYHKIETAPLRPLFKTQEFSFNDHQPLIRTRYSDEYTKSAINFINQKPKKYNWNQFDQLLAGYEDALPEDNKSFFKMKFVVMPAEIPKNSFSITNEKFTDEEIRVEGLRKLISMIERGKYFKDTERKDNGNDSNGEINFYTGNLYDFLTEQVEFLDSTGSQPENSLMKPDTFNKSIKLLNLAHELQGLNGIKIVDRTWHFSIHENCFIGNELVVWLLDHFDDIYTTEDATKYGQLLMDKGLFKHVENRHGFLDGYYFYEFEADYVDNTAKTEKSTRWFTRKKDNIKPIASDGESLKSVNASSDYDLRKIASIGAVSHLSATGGDSDTSSMADSAGSKKPRRKFVLSRAVKYNADPLRKSYRRELISVHYDIVHNPEHCYHIRLQWLNTTTNFIDETINSWARLCERHGLKFVETPWKELCTIPEYNPFHSIVELKLALSPLHDPEFNSPKILGINKFYYHLYLLKEHGFLLDNRSAVYFLKENIEISYSWGKPTFKYAQFIHVSGFYIVELRDNGNFVVAPNNMHISRMSPSVTTENIHSNVYTTESQEIMLNLRKTCNSTRILAAIFKQAKDSWREEMNDVAPTDI